MQPLLEARLSQRSATSVIDLLIIKRHCGDVVNYGRLSITSYRSQCDLLNQLSTQQSATSLMQSTYQQCMFRYPMQSLCTEYNLQGSVESRLPIESGSMPRANGSPGAIYIK